jgi:hypothetical protein
MRWRRCADDPLGCELAEARATISQALDEDLRYGPDVTTLATVPDGAITTASDHRDQV